MTSPSNRALDTVEGLDRPWDTRRIRLLLDGYFVVGDDVHREQSAYEARNRALNGGDLDLVLDHVQMVKACRSIADREVRSAMLLRLFTGEDEYEIELALRSKRSGRHLLERGVELVRRFEGGEHARKNLRKRGMPDGPVCWRCMIAPVDRPGDDCEGACPERPKMGRPSGVDGRSTKAIEDMTVDELVDSQADEASYRKWNRQIPGGGAYVNNVFAAGLIPDDPKEVL